MDIGVWFYGRFRELASRRKIVSLEKGAHLEDLSQRLTGLVGPEFGEELEKTDTYTLIRNQRYCNLITNKDDLLQDGDIVVFLPIIAGG
jgi:molybdopterin converting factor small subunit